MEIFEYEVVAVPRSFTLAASQEVHQLFGSALLDFLVLDDPVVVLVKESEDLSQILRLLLEEVVEDVEFGPLDFIVVVKVVGLKKFLLEFCLVEIFEVVWVGGLFDVPCALFNHFEN